MATPVNSFALVALTMAACVTRLWRLHHPATPVYDETHVGRFLGWYHDRAFFFDVHGPFAKLSMYWSAVTLGYDGRNSCPYESAEPYVASCDMLPQRLLPAVCGAALVPLTYCTCARMQLRPQAMLLAAWFVLIDTHLVGVSRVHLNDAIQLLLIALTHYFALAATAAPPPPPAPLPPWPRLLLQLGTTGLCLGCALQSKYATALITTHYPLTTHYSLPTAYCSLLTTRCSPLTTHHSPRTNHCRYAMALTTLGWLGLQNLWLLGTLAAQRRGARALVLQAAARGLLLLGLPLLLHVLLLRLHFAHLPRSGNGDAYMSPEFQATLEGSRYAESVPFEGRPSFWAQARIRRACGVRAACVRACVRAACVRAARVRHACGMHHACGSYRRPSSSCAQLLEHAQSQFWYNRNMAVLFPRGSHAFDTAWCDTRGASSRGASAPNPAPDPERNPAPDPGSGPGPGPGPGTDRSPSPSPNQVHVAAGGAGHLL